MIYEKAQQYIAARAITADSAAVAGLGVTDNARGLFPAFYPLPAITIPYLDAAGNMTGFGRVRYFDPPMVGGLTKKALRYQQPKGTAPEIYLPRTVGHDWTAILADPTQPLIITEGEVKALSVMTNTQVPTMGLGGVWMWADNKAPLPIMESTDWTRRRVFIVFDSDIDTKPGVQLAEARLAQYLLRRRAVVHTCRLPPGQDGEKQGADDFIAAHGAGGFMAALQDARSLSEMDLQVLALNAQVAWLDGEEKIIEVETGNLIRKDSFTSGSRYATLKVPVQDGKKVRMASVAGAWLSHPMARRYTNTLFLPGGPEIVVQPDATYLNSWHEQPCEPGDVTPMLDLTRWLFEETLGDNWDWPIKLLAFKAQNPTRKIPLAIMLIGEQGSGKSLWASLMLKAFGAYGATKAGKDLNQDWNGFLETSLLALIDDVSARQMRTNIETLRMWISNPRITRIEKFLKNREIDNYATLIFTSNYRDAGAFAHDDRRFLVNGAPKRSQGIEYYAPIYAWLESGKAGPAIYHYLLHYDLAGWTPPIEAPQTAEKRMAYEESLSPFEKLARDMQTSDANVVQMWLQSAEQWAIGVLAAPGHTDTQQANEILASLPAFPIRPWYTAEELAVMFPHMLRDLRISTQRWSHAATPGRVSTALRNSGIYFLRNTDNPDGFMFKGRLRQFLIVCPSAGFPKAMTQAEFDYHMAGMGTYQPVSFRRHS